MGDMGALVMLGSLFGLIAVVVGVVWRFDPEARRPPSGEEGDRDEPGDDDG